MRLLPTKVAGLGDSLVATDDGVLVAHDFPGSEAARLAALVSTTLCLARQVAQETGRGEFREAIVRWSAGYLMAYTAGDNAVVAIVVSEQTLGRNNAS